MEGGFCWENYGNNQKYLLPIFYGILILQPTFGALPVVSEVVA